MPAQTIGATSSSIGPMTAEFRQRLSSYQNKEVIVYFDMVLSATSDGEGVKALCRGREEMSTLGNLRFDIYERSVVPC